MIPRFFIKRPVFAIVLSLLILLAGIVSLVGLPVSQYPEITPPTVVVTVNYPGANAETVEKSLAVPIEQEINGVEGQDSLSSVCSDGMASITVTFKQDRDKNLAAVDVQNRVAGAASKLPAVTTALGLTTSSQSPNVLVYLSLYSPQGTNDEKFLANYANLNVVDVLKRVPGVGSVQLFGSPFAMRIWLKPDRMAGLGITPAEVIRAIKDQNQQSPIGALGLPPTAGKQTFQYTLSTTGTLSLDEEFKNIVVRAGRNGDVLLRDIARVELGSENYSISSTYMGKPAACIGVFQTPGANALASIKQIKAELAKLQTGFPPDMKMDLILDSSSFLDASVTETLHTFVEALLLVLLVVGLFLQSWRATLIPMLAVPVSLVGTFAAFRLLGFSINTLTLFAMVLAIGIVVDDAIVVVEAAQHHLDHGIADAREATRKAMDEVGGAVVAIALVLAAVFIPVAFLGGITGRLYQQFAISIAVSVLLSAVVALTLSPALCGLLLRPSSGQGGRLGRAFRVFNGWFDRLTERYSRGVALCLRRAALVVATLGLMYVCVGGLFKILPRSFVPQEDQGVLFLNVQLPDAASPGRTEAVIRKAETILKDFPEVRSFMAVNGFSLLSGAAAPNGAFMVVALQPWETRGAKAQSLAAVRQRLQARLSGIQDALVMAVEMPALPGLGNTGGFSFQLQDRMGTTPQALARTTAAFVQAARKRPEIGQVYSFFQADTPAISLEIDRDKALRMGVALGDVYNTLQLFLGGAPLTGAEFPRFGRTFKVYLQAVAESRMDIHAIENLCVPGTNGEMVPLGTLLKDMKRVGAPQMLSRYGLFRSAVIGGDAAPGYSSGDAIKAMEEVAAASLPRGYGYAWDGMSRQEAESSGKELPIFGLSLLLVFLLLAAQYESWSLPLAVLLTIPVALLGSLLGQWIGGQENNVFAQIGMVTLIGLAAKNAILIVEFAKDRRAAGVDTATAALEAARLRLRPILMTTLAFVLGVVPLVLASGAGAASRKALGVGVFAGLLGATAIGIFMIPVLYRIIQGWSDRT